MSRRFLVPIKPAPRQRAVRLTAAQKATLVTALAPYPLRASVVRTIEDQLHRYRTARQTDRETIPRLRAFLRKLQRTQALARDLHRVLPAEAATADLRLGLEQRIAHDEQLEVWLRRGLPGKSRPPDYEIYEVAVAVVQALDQARVPITTGKKTPVVEVLGLVRAWATGRRRRRHRHGWSNADYQFTRASVRNYYHFYPPPTPPTRGSPK